MCIRDREDYYPTLKGETDVYAEKPDGKQLEYLTNVVQGVQAKREELEGYITKYSVGWSLSRIASMAVAIMEVCMYEALYIDCLLYTSRALIPRRSKSMPAVRQAAPVLGRAVSRRCAAFWKDRGFYEEKIAYHRL